MKVPYHLNLTKFNMKKHDIKMAHVTACNKICLASFPNGDISLLLEAVSDLYS